ncbi:unnamed protein product, partial [Urochloa humidicola]
HSSSAPQRLFQAPTSSSHIVTPLQALTRAAIAAPSPGIEQRRPPPPLPTAPLLPATSGLDPNIKRKPDSPLADGDYELVPAGGEGQDEGELHAVQVNQEPNQ